MKTLEWGFHSNGNFEGEYDQPSDKVTVDQKLMVGFGCDTIPILLYPHNTWIWVGLNWKFMYFSMGSLLDKCHGGYAESCLHWLRAIKRKGNLNRLCSSWDGGCHNWEATLIGEVLVLGYVIERFRLIIRIPSMIIQGCPWRMYQMLWWKCTPSVECKTIRIAASAVMDGWVGHTVPLSDIF